MHSYKQFNRFLLVTLAWSPLPLAVLTDSAPSGSSQPAKDERLFQERLRVGMTKDEARSALGNPGGTSVNSDGLESWRYSDNAKMRIPFYAVGGGKLKNVTVNFDATGKVKSWHAGEQGLY